MNFKELQEQLAAWQAHNFPGRKSHIPLIGVFEELGELADSVENSEHIFQLTKTLGKLAHAHIKQEQKIRVNENHEEKAKDAVVDCLIFLTDYCNARGWDIQKAIEGTWAEVSKRDWVKFPVNGLTK